MSCINCQCHNCKIVRQHEKLHADFAKRDAEDTYQLWNIPAKEDRRSADLKTLMSETFFNNPFTSFTNNGISKAGQILAMFPDAVKVKYSIDFNAEDYYGYPRVIELENDIRKARQEKIQEDIRVKETDALQDNYTCLRCGCDKLCTITDKLCWKCGEPLQT